MGTVILAIAGDLHLIALGYAIASLGFGLFRPGTTAGTSLAVTRAEQGQASGIVASLAGRATSMRRRLACGSMAIPTGWASG